MDTQLGGSLLGGAAAMPPRVGVVTLHGTGAAAGSGAWHHRPGTMETPRGGAAAASSSAAAAAAPRSVDTSICAEIESVGGLLSALLGSPVLGSGRGGAEGQVPDAEPAAAAATAGGQQLEGLRAQNATLEAALRLAQREVERLTQQGAAMEQSLRDAERSLAQQGAQEEEVSSRRRRHEALRREERAEAVAAAEARAAFAQREAAEARREMERSLDEAAEARSELRHCQEELRHHELAHAHELGGLQRELRELHERTAVVRAQLAERGPQRQPPPANAAGPRAPAAPEEAPRRGLEGAVLELCRRLERDAAAAAGPARPAPEASLDATSLFSPVLSPPRSAKAERSFGGWPDRWPPGGASGRG